MKGVVNMAKIPFSSSIDENVLAEFKKRCKESEPYIPMNTTLELLMRGFNEGKIKLVYSILSVDEKRE